MLVILNVPRVIRTMPIISMGLSYSFLKIRSILFLINLKGNLYTQTKIVRTIPIMKIMLKKPDEVFPRNSESLWKIPININDKISVRTAPNTKPKIRILALKNFVNFDLELFLRSFSVYLLLGHGKLLS